MIKTYLAGPIDRVNIKEAQKWRDWLTSKLAIIGIGALNPFGKMGGDRLGDVRKDLHSWNENGELDKIRDLVGGQIIPPDMVMVEDCTFLTLWIPNDGGEICGSYGEATYAYALHKPVLIVTNRKLKPNKLPNWIIGCSTEIFTDWDSYLKYVYERFTKCQ